MSKKISKSKTVKSGQAPTSDPYDVIDCSLAYKRVQREVQRFCMEQRISHHEIGMGIELHQFEDMAAQQMVHRLMAKVASKKYDVKTVRFPSDWWQAAKRRFFPVWALAKWPVQYTEVTMEANAYHPDVAIPDRATFVEIIMQAKYDGVLR